MPQIAPATIAGLRHHPCDPLILAVGTDGRPLHGLTDQVDWHLGGLISAMVKDKCFGHDAPILRPAHPHLGCGRMILWRIGAATASDIARLIDGLCCERPGLCPQDFQLSEEEVLRAFGDDLTIYRHS